VRKSPNLECTRIPPGVTLFDTMNARFESFPAEEMACAPAPIPLRRRKPKPENAESLLNARFLRVRTASVSTANNSVPSFTSVLCVRL
jgi:hypothetical protein